MINCLLQLPAYMFKPSTLQPANNPSPNKAQNLPSPGDATCSLLLQTDRDLPFFPPNDADFFGDRHPYLPLRHIFGFLDFSFISIIPFFLYSIGSFWLLLI